MILGDQLFLILNSMTRFETKSRYGESGSRTPKTFEIESGQKMSNSPTSRM